MLPCYVVLDVETTGVDPVRDRITEIALLRIEAGQVSARWQSLVQPGRPVPPFIQQLTGISDAMLADAPGFEQLLPQLLPLLDGAVLVAHNARFDHGFVQAAMQRAGVQWDAQTLCTVRLSRRLFPQQRGHGLDALARRHGLSAGDSRHRALGDVELLHAWLQLMHAEFGTETLRERALKLLQNPKPTLGHGAAGP